MWAQNRSRMGNKAHKSLLLCLLIGTLIWGCIIQAACQRYHFGSEKQLGLALVVLGSAADGLVEGYEFDARKSFERKWGVAPSSFFGSESWRKVYRNGNPELGFKSPLHRWYGAVDFYHFADDTRKVGYISGGMLYGKGMQKNTKRWHYLLDVVIVSATASITKSLAMKYIRN